MYCKKCGIQLPDNAPFCTSCGEAQLPNETPASTTAAKPKKPITKRWWFWAAIAVIIIAIIVPTGGNDEEGGASSPTDSPVLDSLPVPSPTLAPSPSPTPEPTLSPEEIEANKEEFKASCVAYPYTDIARSPDDYIYSPAYFKGKVIQVMEGSEFNRYRVNVTEGAYGSWEDTIYVEFALEKGQPRILEDDIVEIYGLLAGLFTYETVMGSNASIPGVVAIYIDIVE